MKPQVWVPTLRLNIRGNNIIGLHSAYRAIGNVQIILDLYMTLDQCFFPPRRVDFSTRLRWLLRGRVDFSIGKSSRADGFWGISGPRIVVNPFKIVNFVSI